jgi:hypothetical protein
MPTFNFIFMVLGMVAWTTRAGDEALLKGQRERQRTAIARGAWRLRPRSSAGRSEGSRRSPTTRAMPIFNFIGMVLAMVAWTSRVRAEAPLKNQREGQRTAIVRGAWRSRPRSSAGRSVGGRRSSKARATPIFDFIGMVLGMVAWTTRVGAEALLKSQREGQRTAIARGA